MKEIPRQAAVTPAVVDQAFTDQWLSRDERSWDEIDSLLETRITGLQTHFQAEGQNYLKSVYGLTRPADVTTSRFLAYVELADEYSQLQGDHDGYAHGLRDSYEDEKVKIRKSAMKGKDAKVRNLWNTYNSGIVTSMSHANEAHDIRGHIYRKAVTDLLSPASDAEVGFEVTQLGVTIEGTLEAFRNNPTPDAFRVGRAPIEGFLGGLTEYLRTTTDESLFSRYSYRNSPGLIRTAADCEVLDTMLSFTLDSHNVVEDEEDGDVVKSLGKSYFSFLGRKTAWQSTRGALTSEYPYYSTIVDMYTAALFRGNISVTRGVSEVVESMFNPAIASGLHKPEMRRFTGNWLAIDRELYQNFYEHIRSIPLLNQEGDREEAQRKFLDATWDIPESVSEPLFSDEERIINSLAQLRDRWNDPEYSHVLGKSNIVSPLIDPAFDSFMKEFPDMMRDLHVSARDYQRLMRMLGELPILDIGRKLGYEVDFRVLVSGDKPARGSNRKGIETQDDNGLAEIIQRQGEIFKGAKVTGDLNRLNTFLKGKFPVEAEQIDRTQKENDYLWREILDNSNWFVSPRGDRFSVRNDEELGQHMIDSVTYTVDRTHPREHKVTLQLNAVDNPLVFWMDTRGNLLDEDRKIITASPGEKQELINLLLKRLFTVTSGLLSSEIEETERGEGERSFEYRRAHYRHLNSTAARPITMESHGAQLHAAEIRKDYGIDIYDEIRRRRMVGTLQPHEYVTFVAESKPATSGELVKPNELKFNPHKLILPL